MLPVNFSKIAFCFPDIVPCSENIFSSLAINRSNKIYSKSQLFPPHSYFANKIFQATKKKKFNNENALHANNFSPFSTTSNI